MVFFFNRKLLLLNVTNEMVFTGYIINVSGDCLVVSGVAVQTVNLNHIFHKAINDIYNDYTAAPSVLTDRAYSYFPTYTYD